MSLQEGRKTQIVIICQDNTKRVINSLGMWNIAMATQLGKDLENSNFKDVVLNGL